MDSRPSRREKQLERELERYKRKVGELSMQIDLLKKINDSSTCMRKSSGYVVSFTDVVESVPQFIESVYNRKRVHSGIKYLPPEEFEDILLDEGRKHQLEQVTLKLSN